MSLIKANTIKPVTSGTDLSLQGDSGGSAVDCLNITSAGNVNFSGNTDAKIKLPSAGGIYKGASDTAILTESGGAVTLDNVILGSSIEFPAGYVIKTQMFQVNTTTTVTSTSFNVADVTGDFQFTPTFASSDILLIGCVGATTNSSDFFIDFYKNASDFTETANLSGETSGLHVINTAASWGSCTLVFLDTCSENSTSEKTYKFSARNYGSATGYLGYGADLPSTLIIQEIKR
mgnify:CR=1 FL=1